MSISCVYFKTWYLTFSSIELAQVAFFYPGYLKGNRLTPNYRHSYAIYRVFTKWHLSGTRGKIRWDRTKDKKQWASKQISFKVANWFVWYLWTAKPHPSISVIIRHTSFFVVKKLTRSPKWPLLYEGTRKEERAPGVSAIDMRLGRSVSGDFHMILVAGQFLSLLCSRDMAHGVTFCLWTT